MELLRVLIGPALRRERRSQRRTLKDVADAARVSITHLSEVERGRKEVSSEVLEAICGALGLSVVDLLETIVVEIRTAQRPLVLRSFVESDARPSPGESYATAAPRNTAHALAGRYPRYAPYGRDRAVANRYSAPVDPTNTYGRGRAGVNRYGAPVDPTATNTYGRGRTAVNRYATDPAVTAYPDAEVAAAAVSPVDAVGPASALSPADAECLGSLDTDCRKKDCVAA